MLYKFKSAAAGDVIMMEANGNQVLEAIGREPAERGVIQAQAMQDAIDKLKLAIQASQAKASQPPEEREEEDADANSDPIPFHTRAQPFLQLLQISLEEGKDVVWGV